MYSRSFLNRLKTYLCNCLVRTLQTPRVVFYKLISSPILTGKPRRNQPVLVYGNGSVFVHKNVSIGFFPSPSFFSTYAHIEARGKNSSISIGACTAINNNFCAIAEHTSITIGAMVFIGANVEILDSDFHGLERHERNISKPERAKPVVINDEVFIGNNVRILKGVKIGDGAVIANGSVVSCDVPANCIFAGNPAKLIKYLQSD